ncbi:hypothetical protein [Phenylobacterium sp. J367]|uniref:hypothetical protein n=1 Tax=Phenylobacterium sp. J367 TaxID=2898435 RepID=UPI002150AFD8|nr:hypothetical protein [Phenylobacterium sp. J367]MCR5881111.1 hypothetical protein [Phenylobacterium sp. J367]
MEFTPTGRLLVEGDVADLRDGPEEVAAGDRRHGVHGFGIDDRDRERAGGLGAADLGADDEHVLHGHRIVRILTGRRLRLGRRPGRHRGERQDAGVHQPQRFASELHFPLPSLRFALFPGEVGRRTARPATVRRPRSSEDKSTENSAG